MAAVKENDAPYGVTTPPPEVDPISLPWWADVIDCHELADVIRKQCDEKVCLCIQILSFLLFPVVYTEYIYIYIFLS